MEVRVVCNPHYPNRVSRSLVTEFEWVPELRWVLLLTAGSIFADYVNLTGVQAGMLAVFTGNGKKYSRIA
jgi:hypothetical protein